MSTAKTPPLVPAILAETATAAKTSGKTARPISGVRNHADTAEIPRLASTMAARRIVDSVASWAIAVACVGGHPRRIRDRSPLDLYE
jgi:hypothetical protein